MQKVEKLKSTLHGLGAAKANKHIVFVDTPDQVQQFDAVEYFDTLPEAVERCAEYINRCFKTTVSVCCMVEIPSIKNKRFNFVKTLFG